MDDTLRSFLEQFEFLAGISVSIVRFQLPYRANDLALQGFRQFWLGLDVAAGGFWAEHQSCDVNNDQQQRGQGEKLELIDRGRRTIERRIKESKFPAVKSRDSFAFAAIPSLNKTLVLELARSEYVGRRENVIAVGNSGTGKTHVALGLGLAACPKGLPVGFTTAAALVHELHEARDEKRLLRLQHQLAGYKLLIVDELGYVPLSPTGAELLFEVFSQRYERGATIVASDLPFDEWTKLVLTLRPDEVFPLRVGTALAPGLLANIVPAKNVTKPTLPVAPNRSGWRVSSTRYTVSN